MPWLIIFQFGPYYIVLKNCKKLSPIQLSGLNYCIEDSHIGSSSIIYSLVIIEFFLFQLLVLVSANFNSLVIHLHLPLGIQTSTKY